MIDYFKGMYGLNTLSRVHGSSLYKGSLVGLVSVAVYLCITLRWNRRRDVDPDLDHPYGVGVLVSSVTFLIIFRANNGYQRYWEAVGAVNHFMSKWMDATQHTAVFHLQSSTYDGARPPSFFNHDGLNKLNLTRNRKRHHSSERRLSSVYDCKKERGHTFSARSPSDAYVDDISSHISSQGGASMNSGSRLSGIMPNASPGRKSPGRKAPLPSSVLEGYWDIIPPTPRTASSAMIKRTAINSRLFPSTQCPNLSFAVRPNGRTPPLFLQELAHLSSLACAVALSTLRNDMEYSESPLDLYIPGTALPPSDPDRLPKCLREQFQHRFYPVTIVHHWLGLDRLPQWRTKYNAARPMRILGGVSNAEIQFLQRARGPHAKAQLALIWLKEFLIREHLEGALGEVHSAIISRMVQFLSDGMLAYHHARQVMYVPFPFPHAQLSVFFAAVMVFAVPFLMDQYANEIWLGSAATFLTVTCLAGLHEVARELENPFRNVPNEIPLCTLMAKYNEALVGMFSGFNPDSFWDAEAYQGALDAMALGRMYGGNGGVGNGGVGNGGVGNGGVGSAAEGFPVKGGILAMNPIAEEPATSASPSPLGTEKGSEWISEKGSVEGSARGSERARPGGRVAFSAPAGPESGAARDLRETLRRQASEIRELERTLDGRASGDRGGEGDAGSAAGSAASRGSSSSRRAEQRK